MQTHLKITFSNGLKAEAVQIREAGELASAFSKLSLNHSRPALVLIGGAEGLSQADLNRLRPLFLETLAPLAQSLGASVFDGGTDAGVMRLMGQARAENCGDFPLIGVAAVGTVALPGAKVSRTSQATLEPNHTHFLLVPGSKWGDESPWLSRAAGAMANGSPSVTVLVNGGETAWEDVSESVKAGRPVVVVDGSGRVADELAAALAGARSEQRAMELAASGLLRVADLGASSISLTGVLEEILSTKS